MTVGITSLPSAVIRKAQPDMAAVHAVRPLTNFSVKYTRDSEDFFALRIFPSFGVAKNADFYWRYMRGYAWRNEVRKRAPNSETVEMGYGLEQANYVTDIWGVHIDIPWETQANADPGINPDEDATGLVTEQQLLNMDVQFKANFLKTGVWGQDVQGVVSTTPTSTQFTWFSDYANSDPVKVFRAWKRRIKRMTGKRANTLAISPDVLDVLLDHPDIIDRVKYNQQSADKPSMTSDQTLAALFGVREIIVMDTPLNVAKEKANTTAPVVDNVSMTDISSNEMLLFHKPERVGVGSVVPGLTFNWTAYPGAGANGMRIGKIPIPLKHSNRIESESAWGQNVVAPDAAVYFYNVLS